MVWPYGRALLSPMCYWSHCVSLHGAVRLVARRSKRVAAVTLLQV